MSQQLSVLRSRIQQLELELQEFKSGRMVVNEDGSVVVNDMANEITMLRTENDRCVYVQSIETGDLLNKSRTNPLLYVQYMLFTSRRTVRDSACALCDLETP